MNTYKAYKFRIYPNREQKIMIDKTFGCTRFIFNKFLSERKTKYEESKIKLSAYDELKELTDLKKENKWLKEVDSRALQKCVFNLDDAFKNFFHGNGYPRFKAKGEHESYTTNNILNEYKNEEVKDLSVRKWVCSRCGFEHDRDINASENIMFEGLKIYMKESII